MANETMRHVSYASYIFHSVRINMQIGFTFSHSLRVSVLFFLFHSASALAKLIVTETQRKTNFEERENGAHRFEICISIWILRIRTRPARMREYQWIHVAMKEHRIGAINWFRHELCKFYVHFCSSVVFSILYHSHSLRTTLVAEIIIIFMLIANECALWHFSVKYTSAKK